MKLLTLNTHSLVEENYTRKLEDFVEAVSKELHDVIALQEVNQTACGEEVPKKAMYGYFPCSSDVVIRADNHIYNAVDLLAARGIRYFWTWLPMKLGYDRYDEGIALMSRSPILEAETVLVSGIDDYNNWKTRKIIGIRTADGGDEWFYSVHYGWWSDEEEPFQEQWKRTDSFMMKYDTVWLMGDFNSPSQVRGEGYDMILSSCWHDSYVDAESKDSGITVGHVIDGWKEKISSTEGMRIDQIWCSRRQDVNSSRVVFNGQRYPVVSDHYGVLIEYERK